MDAGSRKVIIAANWKMYKNLREVHSFFINLIPEIKNHDAEVVVFPPAILIPIVQKQIEKGTIKLGAQNAHWEKEGAHTGEISMAMIKEFNCTYCLLGHSERRHNFDESSEMVALKAQSALENNITPIICIGETLIEREAGETKDVLRGELLASLSGIESPSENIVIAYEPVWAIGTGKVACSNDAEWTISYIRDILREQWGDIADKISMLYGGSVTADNIKSLMSCPNIDGVLVGGASLKPDSFVEIINYNQ